MVDEKQFIMERIICEVKAYVEHIALIKTRLALLGLSVMMGGFTFKFIYVMKNIINNFNKNK